MSENKEDKKETKEDSTAEAPAKAEVKEAAPAEKTPEIRPGYTIRVHQKIKDGKKERIQIFEGMVLSMQGSTPATKTMTVYKESQGVGVEKIFPLALPTIAKIEVVKKAKVRQANLKYLKDYRKKLKEERIIE